ncbi:MAG: thioesterase family protein [Bryobacteraceae bacterium]|nr:thioesterase family protein [Bryobacteraceae bacterium]
MSLIPVGTVGERRFLVDAANAISFLGHDDCRVLATPWMILYMEMTSRDLVKPLLEPGEDTVGTEVNVRHLAASPMGFEVTFRAEVIAVDGRRVSFRVEARDSQHVIGEGTHERAIIDVERFADRLRSKRSAPA